jgi:hypothetical protein
MNRSITPLKRFVGADAIIVRVLEDGMSQSASANLRKHIGTGTGQLRQEKFLRFIFCLRA